MVALSLEKIVFLAGGFVNFSQGTIRVADFFIYLFNFIYTQIKHQDLK